MDTKGSVNVSTAKIAETLKGLSSAVDAKALQAIGTAIAGSVKGADKTFKRKRFLKAAGLKAK